VSIINDETDVYLSKIFTEIDLCSAVLTMKDFEDCLFEDCNFCEATFEKCNFTECRFLRCNFSNLKIEQSKFLDVIFDECKVIGIDWTKVTFPSVKLCSPFKFYKCILNDSIFFGLELDEIVIEDCKAHDVDFREGSFKNANFKYTDFENSLFHTTNLTSANFTEAINYNIDLYINEIKWAIFSRTEAVNLLNSLEIELVE